MSRGFGDQYVLGFDKDGVKITEDGTKMGEERETEEKGKEGEKEEKIRTGHRWVKGQSGRPPGRPPRMTELELARTIDRYMDPAAWAQRVTELAKQNDDRTVAVAALRLLAQYRLSEPLKRSSVDVFAAVAHVGELEMVAARLAVEAEERRRLATDAQWRELPAPATGGDHGEEGRGEVA